MYKTRNELKRRFLELSTPDVSDAMDFLDIQNGTLDKIKSLQYGINVFGSAFTVEYGDRETNFCKAGDYIDNVPEECVIIIDSRALKSIFQKI